MDLELAMLRSLGVTVLIGALIGLEREYHHRLKGETGFAGLRTFIFFSVLGNLAAWLAVSGHPYVLPVALLGLILLLTVNYFRPSDQHDRGMTTEVASLLAFLLGSLVAVGDTTVAVSLGVVIAVLLSAKPTFLRWVERMTPEDIYTTLKFAVVAFVVFPFLPDRNYGPFGAFNPHEIWLMVVLISGVSFVGYVALKLLGPGRGIGLSGLLGGLASSTAVAVSFSRHSKENPGHSRSCALAVVLASTVMIARVVVLAGVVNPRLLAGLWPYGLVLGLSGAAVSVWLWRGSSGGEGHGEVLEVRNPFRLSAVLTFGVAYAAVLFLVKASPSFLPDGSLNLVAIVSGLTQVDALTLSAANLAGRDLEIGSATTAILVAVLSNTVSKAVIGLSMGSPGLRRPLLGGLGVMFGIGLVLVAAIRFA